MGASWDRNNGLTGEIQGTRKKIYDYVMAHPGTHPREIGRELGLAMGDLQYHLYTLEKLKAIKGVRRGLYKYIYPSNVFGDRESIILSVLSQETPRELLLFLIERPGSSQTELAKFTQLSAPTINWHMKRLVEQGVVERERKGKSVTYKLREDPDQIRGYIQNYHSNFWEKWASHLADVFMAFGVADEGENGQTRGEHED